jgi:hypothetical protein
VLLIRDDIASEEKEGKDNEFKDVTIHWKRKATYLQVNVSK